jgi:hypothetical protein
MLQYARTCIHARPCRRLFLVQVCVKRGRTCRYDLRNGLNKGLLEAMLPDKVAGLMLVQIPTNAFMQRCGMPRAPSGTVGVTGMTDSLVEIQHSALRHSMAGMRVGML